MRFPFTFAGAHVQTWTREGWSRTSKVSEHNYTFFTQ